jgi:hypothetical protein
MYEMEGGPRGVKRVSSELAALSDPPPELGDEGSLFGDGYMEDVHGVEEGVYKRMKGESDNHESSLHTQWNTQAPGNMECNTGGVGGNPLNNNNILTEIFHPEICCIRKYHDETRWFTP